MTQPQHTHPPTLWLWAAAGLGVTAISASVLLIATDGITGSSRWAHHPGISAAPLLLISAAIAAGSLAQPPRQRRPRHTRTRQAGANAGAGSLRPQDHPASAGFPGDEVR